MKRLSYIFLALACSLSVMAADKKSVTPALSEKTSDVFTYYFYEAVRCFEIEEYDQCFALLLYCQHLNPNDAETQEMLGMLYAGIRADDLANTYFARAVDLAPQIWRYRYAYVNRLYQSEQYDSAIDILKKGIKYDSNNEEIWNVLSYVYREKKDYANAIKALNEVERIVGPDRQNSFTKYKYYTALGQDKKALKEIETYLKSVPQDFEFQCFKGNVYLENGRTEEAYRIFKEILNEHPDNHYVYTSLANYFTHVGNHKMAVKTITDALQSGLLDINSKISIFMSNKEMLDSQDVNLEDIMLNLIDQEPMNVDLYTYYATYLHELSDTAKLIPVLMTITDLQPSNSSVWSELADISIDQRNDSLFAEVTNRAINLLPEEAKWYYYKSILLLRDGKTDDAKQCCLNGIEVAQSKDLSYKLALYRQLGDIYTMLEQYDSTYVAYEQVLAYNPNDNYVLNNYAYMLAIHGGDLKKAEKMSAKTIEHDATNATYLDTYAWILYLQGSPLARFYIEKARENADPEQEIKEIEEHYNIIHGK